MSLRSLRMINLTSSSILLGCSIGLLYLLFRTNSLRASISTTMFISSIALTSFLHMLELYFASLSTVVIVMAYLVWRVIPVDTIDTWKKAH